MQAMPNVAQYFPRHYSDPDATARPSLQPHGSYRSRSRPPQSGTSFNCGAHGASQVSPPRHWSRRLRAGTTAAADRGPMSRVLKAASGSLQTGHFSVKGSFEEQFSPPLQNSSEFKGPGDGFYAFPIGCKCGIGAALKILIFPDPFIMASPVRVERFTIFPNPIPSSQYANPPRRYTVPVIMALLYRNHISIVVCRVGGMAPRSGGDGAASDTAPRGHPAAF